MKTYNKTPQPAVVLAGAAVVLFSFSAGAAFNAPGYEGAKTLFPLKAEHKKAFSDWKQAFIKNHELVDPDIWEVESNEYQALQEEIKQLENRMSRTASFGLFGKKAGNISLKALAQKKEIYLQDEARFKELIQARDAMAEELRKKSKLAAKADKIGWYKRLRTQIKAAEQAYREAVLDEHRTDLSPVLRGKFEIAYNHVGKKKWKLGKLLEKHHRAQQRFVPEEMKREAKKNYDEALKKLNELEAKADAARSKAAGAASTFQTPLANCIYTQVPIIVSVDNTCSAKSKGSACVGTVHCVDKKTKAKYTGQAYCHVNSEGFCPSAGRCAEDNSIQTAVDKNANNRAQLVLVKDDDVGVDAGTGAVH